MKRTPTLSIVSFMMVVTMLVTGCQTIMPAPGSDKVQLTRDPKDVAGCKAVGNIAVPKEDSGDAATAETEFRNRAIGLGGNAALVTSHVANVPLEGIAYHCD